ncbi:hypothetical protein COCCU_00725 [Corynebacterium occultum]|uniref:Uncharacterized protein n=1 Tax=Corynebacterium occultum TaxID=2675219 RepID=A0A6B8VPU9_9CORY|nr:hypothetical protein [Corynebacterium occultum]QGU06113.1 hypothetical protein COCCU_00725 [Corynebacterium occultum]
MSTETFLTPAELDILRGLLGQELSSYGTDLEIDEGLAAFDVWLECEQGWVHLAYEETVVDFDAGFENVESLLRIHPQGGEFPGWESHDLKGRITKITRIQDKITAVDKLEEAVAWEWWRESGLRFTLDSGQELIIHRAATVNGEVRMRAGDAGGVEPDPIPKRPFQEGQKRRYEFERREVEL